MFFLSKIKLKNKYLLVTFLLSFIGVFPLLHPGLPPTHDGEYHVIRFYQFYKTLSDGNFYPRWAPDLNAGLGVPLFNYVYPFPNYVTAFLHVIGVSFIDAFKLNLFIATLVGTYLFYVFMQYYTDDIAASAGAIFYSFAPYRFVDIYVRGSVGEVWALAFLPGLLLFIVKSIKTKRTFIIPAGFLLSFIIFSHNILGLMFAFFAFIYGLLIILQVKEKKYSFITLLVIFSIGISLSAIFWLPALLETKYVQGLEVFDVTKHFVDLYQLLIPSWGTGFSGGGFENQMSFQIGLIHLLASVISIIYFLFFGRKKELFVISVFMAVWLISVVIMMLKISLPLWTTIPLISFFQFPWRFLSLVIFLTSCLTSFFIFSLNGYKRKFLFTILFVFTCLITTINYTKPAYYHDRSDTYYTTRSNFIDGTNSPGNSFNTYWIHKVPENKDIQIFPKDKGYVLSKQKRAEFHFYKFTVLKETLAQLPIAYFPGWTVFANGKKIEPIPSNNGLVQIQLFPGEYSVEVYLLDTILRRVATVWTLLTFFCLLLLSLKYKIYEYRN